MNQGKLYDHFKHSTLVSIISVAAVAGSVAFARRTASISPEFDPLTYTSVSLGTLTFSYGAYIVLELLKKYTERPYEFFGYLSGATLVLSFMPIGHVATSMPGAGLAEINVLGLTHVVAAVFITVSLAKLELMKK